MTDKQTLLSKINVSKIWTSARLIIMVFLALIFMYDQWLLINKLNKSIADQHAVDQQQILINKETTKARAAILEIAKTNAITIKMEQANTAHGIAANKRDIATNKESAGASLGSLVKRLDNQVLADTISKVLKENHAEDARLKILSICKQ